MPNLDMNGELDINSANCRSCRFRLCEKKWSRILIDSAESVFIFLGILWIIMQQANNLSTRRTPTGDTAQIASLQYNNVDVVE